MSLEIRLRWSLTIGSERGADGLKPFPRHARRILKGSPHDADPNSVESVRAVC
jgi:hypothetical protein